MDRELFCVSAFLRYLQMRKENRLLYCERVSRGQDPPDFYIDIEGKRYNVEVTSIKMKYSPSLGEKEIEAETFDEAQSSIVSEVEKKATENGFLNNTYVVTFERPLSSEKYNKVKQKVVAELLEYIEKSRYLTKAEEQIINIQKKELCRIQKFSSDDSMVEQTQNNVHWLGDVKIEICCKLCSAVEEKCKKMTKKQVPAPRILLLLNTHPLAKPEMYNECLEKNNLLNYFSTIAVISKDWNKHLVVRSVDEIIKE